MITVNNLSFGYSKQDKLFDQINLQLKQGTICGLLGKNGSGKTTLLKLMAGLIFPNEGSCLILNENPVQRRPIFLEEFYFLPEDLFVPAISVQQYIKFYSAFYSKFDPTFFNNALREFDLPQDKLLTTFSHGQKKKFLIAFGLATNAKICVLDEPTNGLDIPSKAQFRKLLASTITDERLFIISTHQVHDVENLIDSVVILDEGKIVLHQSLHDITKQLAFIQQPTEPNLTDCFYYEKYLGGYTALIANKQEHETQIDLEILFNAILSNKAKIQSLFSEGQHEIQ